MPTKRHDSDWAEVKRGKVHARLIVVLAAGLEGNRS